MPIAEVCQFGAFFMVLQGFFTIADTARRYRDCMPKLALAALALLVPATAFADEEQPTVINNVTVNPVITVSPAPTPPPPPAPAEPAPVTVEVAPPVAVAPPGAPEAAPQVDGDPCVSGHYQHGRWRSRLKGRLAIGFAKSHLELGDHHGDGASGKQKSLVGRLAFRRGFAIELELARGEIGDDNTKTFGGALVKSFGKRKLQPYLIAGGGGGRLEHADGTDARMRYAEFGGGLMVKGRRIGIGVDFRRGVRNVEDTLESTMETMARETTSPDHHDRWGDKERYTRGRILALVHF